MSSVIDYISNRCWILRECPFRHVVATDIFLSGFYSKLNEAFIGALERGDAVSGRDDSFRRDMRGYDAYGLTFNSDVEKPFDLLFSNSWRDIFSNLFDADITSHMSGGLHHHPIGSQSGNIHNDLNPGWFVDIAMPDGTIMSDRRICSYKNGDTTILGHKSVELVRAVTIIIFLANGDWESKNGGGQTALYNNCEDSTENPERLIDPIDNSLLAFECTPYSFHAFVSNRLKPRNSLIMWLHQSKENALQRWGPQSIVYWS